HFFSIVSRYICQPFKYPSYRFRVFDGEITWESLLVKFCCFLFSAFLWDGQKNNLPQEISWNERPR
ncbi:hypothetical protein L9F63_024507, partial [Diploptera punctata]